MPQLLEKLFALRDNDTGLSYMSARLLALENQQEQFHFINENMTFLQMADISSG